MSDVVTNEELRDILDLIKRKTGRDIDSEIVLSWRRENIEQLLALIEKEKPAEEPQEEPAAEEPVQEEPEQEELLFEEEINETEESEKTEEEEEKEEELPPQRKEFEGEDIFSGRTDDDLYDSDPEMADLYEKLKSMNFDSVGASGSQDFDADDDDGDEGSIEVKKAETESSDERIKKLLDGGEAPKKTVDVPLLFGDTKGLFSSFAKKLKKTAKKIGESFAVEDEDLEQIDDDVFGDDEDEFELPVLPDSDSGNEESEFTDDDDGDEFDEDDGDMKIAEFPKKENGGGDDADGKATHKTVWMEKPGMVIRKGEHNADDDLEGAPIIMSAEDALANDPNSKIPTIEKMENDMQKNIRKALEDGQYIFDGFIKKEPPEDAPEEIEEDEAERQLFEKRKKKMEEFVLFGDDEDEDPYGTDPEKEKIGELFESNDARPHRKEPEKFDGPEYDQTNDARRVFKFLSIEKKKSSRRLIAQCVLFGLSVLTGVASAIKTTVAGDRFMTIFVSLVLISVSLIISGQTVIKSFSLLKKKKFNINTVTSFAAVICFIQTLLMFVLYFFDNNPVSVFGCAGVGLLLLSELNTHVMNCRTADALDLCTGGNKDKLYSIESISDDKDLIELGRSIRSKSPRIRYSCKTRFPAHLIELCMSETSADRRSKLLLVVIALMSLVNFAAAWIVNGKFAVGFAAFSVTFASCVPAYGALLIQLPLRWVNRKINCDGAMVSCQDGVNDIYRTNAIVVDSIDLFDIGHFELIGHKNFGLVRYDDALLYSTAMVFRSGGPLKGMFEGMSKNISSLIPAVKSFRYEERLGVSAWINNQKVIFGNKELMINHNISIPKNIDVDFYISSGHQVVFLGVGDVLAEMYVVDYVPNRTIAPMLKKMRDSGVSILVRNCDPNVTEKMISECFNMELDNIKVMSSSSGRIFKKYKTRPKVATNAVSVHDGSVYAFLKTLCTAAALSHTFKVTDLLSWIGIGMGFAIMLVLSILNVIADLPAIFVILLQTVITGAFIGITKISCGK